MHRPAGLCAPLVNRRPARPRSPTAGLAEQVLEAPPGWSRSSQTRRWPRARPADRAAIGRSGGPGAVRPAACGRIARSHWPARSVYRRAAAWPPCRLYLAHVRQLPGFAPHGYVGRTFSCSRWHERNQVSRILHAQDANCTMSLAVVLILWLMFVRRKLRAAGSAAEPEATSR